MSRARRWDHRGFRSPTPEDPRWWFSQSGVNTFRSCPEQARVLWSGEVADVTKVQALLGTGAHAYMEHREDLGWERKVADVIAAEFTAQGGRMGPSDHPMANDPHLVLKTAVAAGQVFARHLPGEPLFAEQKLTADFPFGVHPKGIEGSPDFVRDWRTGHYQVIISDFKVSEGRKYRTGRGGEAWKLQRYATQPRFYAWLTARFLGIPLHAVGWEYLVCNPKTLELTVIPITIDVSDLERIGREMDGIINTAMHMPGQWPLRTDDWHCSPEWCPNYSNCVGSFRPALTLTKETHNAP